MSDSNKLSVIIIILLIIFSLLFPLNALHACNGKDVVLSDNANLGMLGAYNDAKVMKSSGEISDRYFTQRENNTFFLENDSSNHIIAQGHMVRLVQEGVAFSGKPASIFYG